MNSSYGSRCLLLTLIALIGVGCLPSRASAAIGPELVRFGELGKGAGQFGGAEGRGMVADPQSGHLYVTDDENARVSVFTAWGDFVKAFGWGVRDGSLELQTCTEQTGCRAGTVGAAGGQMVSPRAIARDQAGNLYVYEAGTIGRGKGFEPNRRVQVFDTAGDFLRSFGGDVVAKGPGDSANNEIQSVRVAASTGTFRLGFKGPLPGSEREYTAPLAYNDSAAEVQAALDALESIGPAGGSVSVSGGPGDIGGSAPYEVEFHGTVGGDDIVPLTLEGSDLSGESGVATIQSGGGPEICMPASGDVCKIGIEGTGSGEFSLPTGGDTIDFGPDGTLYVGDKGRIQEFEADGSFTGEISFSAIHASDPKFPDEVPLESLAVDPASGDLYLAFRHEYPFNVSPGATSWRLTQAGQLVPPAPLLPTGENQLAAQALATDAAGNLFASVFPLERVGDFNFNEPEILELDPHGAAVDRLGLEPAYYEAVTTNVVTATGASDVYAFHGVAPFTGVFNPYIIVRGPAPDKWPPPPVPPGIDDQFASIVGTESAVLKAEINPKFWADTRYFLEYGEADCSGGGCTQVPAAPGKSLGAGIVKSSVTTDGIFIGGLQPGTTYHYRFVAESGGGGPVYGPDETFITRTLPAQPQSGCPNAGLRIGAAATLPDCRAYELVSPVDKNGGELDVPGTIALFPARLEQSDPGGEKITYTAAGSFAGAPSGGYVSQYLASRAPGGWSTTPISPPRVNGSLAGPILLDSYFKAFLPDLSSGWVLEDSRLLLTADAEPGFVNLYRRDNTTGGYEALTTAPRLGGSSTDAPAGKLEGFSADGRRAVFASEAKLTSNASSGAGQQLYEAFEGKVHLVSLLPGGGAALNASVGSRGSEGFAFSRATNAGSAVSAAGDRIYWSTANPDGTGNLYVRVNGTKTVEVSAGAEFWSATPDGSTALYSQGGALNLFDLASKSSAQIASGVEGVLGASEGLSRIYFVSRDELAAGGHPGKPNLYLYEAGSPTRFVATLSSGDVGDMLSPVALAPWQHVSRVTADGGVAVFMSTAALTGAANVDQESGHPDAEVFRYDAGTSQLHCLSCTPTGARPSGGQQGGVNPAPGIGEKSPTYWYASRIPGWELEFHAPRVLSGDGNRVFFDSTNRLTLGDTNGREDVYQWEKLGTGECSQAAPGFDARTGGCVTLISNGQGPTRSEFIDASEDGHDVFFLTGTSLLTQDIGQTDLYDARVDGGFPAPPAPPAACEGEACQGPPSPPNDAVPGSSTYRGAGNVREGGRHCPKGKRRVKRNGETICVRHRKHRRKSRGSR